MIPGHIDGATHVMTSPREWREEGRKCSSLPIRANGGIVSSAWFPTPEELERLFSGAPVYLTIVAPPTSHPPVALSVGPAPVNLLDQ